MLLTFKSGKTFLPLNALHILDSEYNEKTTVFLQGC